MGDKTRKKKKYCEGLGKEGSCARIFQQDQVSPEDIFFFFCLYSFLRAMISSSCHVYKPHFIRQHAYTHPHTLF